MLSWSIFMLALSENIRSNVHAHSFTRLPDCKTACKMLAIHIQAWCVFFLSSEHSLTIISVYKDLRFLISIYGSDHFPMSRFRKRVLFIPDNNSINSELFNTINGDLCETNLFSPLSLSLCRLHHQSNQKCIGPIYTTHNKCVYEMYNIYIYVREQVLENPICSK